MKRKFLISLIVGLFLVVSGGVATAADYTHTGDVLIEGDDTDANSQEATLKITQPVRNAPYTTPEGWEYRDAIPLLVEGKAGLTETKDLNTILVISSYGDSESELRFDNGYSVFDSDPIKAGKMSWEIDPKDISSMNAYIYTQYNDYTLRLVPGPFGDKALADVRLRKVVSSYSDTNIELQISAQTESDASLTFRKGSIQDAPPGDPGIDTAKIYRPADPNSNELRIAVADVSDVLQDRMVIDSDGNVGIGTMEPEAKLTVADGAILALGTTGVLPASVSGEGTRLMWIPAKAAFRAGAVVEDLWSGVIDQWDDVNIGLYSSAMGYGTTASGESSTATGRYTIASGTASVAMGTKTTASGGESTAMGYNTIASGNASVTMGMDTYATGNNSFAMGRQATASGGNSIAMGRNLNVAGNSSFGIGLNDSYSTINQANTMAIMGGKVGIGTVSPQSALAVSGLPTAAPDASGTAGALCVTNAGNIWIDSDGTYDCQ